MAGLPGSGKTFIRSKLYEHYDVVDCDEIKKTIPGYNADQPRALHSESKIIEKYEIYKNLKNRVSFVYDTTATNTDKVIKLTKQAQGLGYIVKVVYVKVSLSVAMERNSKRFRVVPDDVILDKYSKLETSINIFRCFANDVITIDNEQDEVDLSLISTKRLLQQTIIF